MGGARNMSGELTVPVDFSHATAIYHSDFSVVLSLMHLGLEEGLGFRV